MRKRLGFLYVRTAAHIYPRSDNGEDHEKHYSLCTNAANRITSIGMTSMNTDRRDLAKGLVHLASTYKDTYGMAKSSVFPCYYVFTAGVMHTWTCKPLVSLLVALILMSVT